MKDFKYPKNIGEIMNFLKEKDLDLYEKIRQTRNIVAARFSDTEGKTARQTQQKAQTSQKQIRTAKEEEQKFIKNFNMSERNQLTVLKDW